MSKLPSDVAVLGDPHLGRRFKTGVPLHRAGERERLHLAEFSERLAASEARLHVNMGDLFDRFIVPPEIVLFAAECYREVAAANPATTFILLRGNHDVSRDTARRSSFDLFTCLVREIPNIIVVDSEPLVWGGYGFVPYTPFQPTSALVEALPDGLNAVFGHWDVQDWGGDNVIPTQILAAKAINLAITGHDHLARQEKRHGVDIILTGSMQPFSHAEDPNGDWYVTLTLDELEPDAVQDKNVRVLLREGETLPGDLDCLSLTAKRIPDQDQEEIAIDTRAFESLDLKVMLAEVLDGLDCKNALLAKFEEIPNA